MKISKTWKIKKGWFSNSMQVRCRHQQCGKHKSSILFWGSLSLAAFRLKCSKISPSPCSVASTIAQSLSTLVIGINVINAKCEESATQRTHCLGGRLKRADREFEEDYGQTAESAHTHTRTYENFWRKCSYYLKHSARNPSPPTLISCDPPSYTSLCIARQIVHPQHLNRLYQCIFAGFAAIACLLFVVVCAFVNVQPPGDSITEVCSTPTLIYILSIFWVSYFFRNSWFRMLSMSHWISE